MKGFEIIKLTDIDERLTEYHKTGAKRGVFVGFDCFEDYYSMKESGCTDWTGSPMSGKTEMVLELLFNTSEFYGWKHLLYVPDIGDCIEVMAILIHKYTGKTFERKYTNHIDIKAAFNACTWLLEHFYILEKTNPKATMTPVQFWEFAVEFKKDHHIQTATIDSWKDMNHNYTDYGGTYAIYLSNVLPIRNMLSEQNNIHFHTIIHPKQPRRVAGKKQAIEVDDMEGGAQWNNSGKTIIGVQRDNFAVPVTDIYFLKVKPRSVGKWGVVAINFDVARSRYFELSAENGGKSLYAHRKVLAQAKIIDFTEPKKESTIQPNLGFAGKDEIAEWEKHQ